ncbi:MAG: type II secretion system protein [Selenomonadaceae bacterium]|nr:type II secretion system protein [Selenomonadaceae bacterium]
MNRLNNQRGFMLLNVIILMLITSFAAVILMNAAPRIKNSQSVLRLTAIHLANEQFAMLESLAANGESLTEQKNFKATTYNLGKNNPIVFEVNADVPDTSTVSKITSLKVKVTVTIVDDENFQLETERTILFVPQTE